ncbi:MAG: hypothetical protein GWO16_08445 [Gammaproteobacteria bacterium]|nr:hypothetical protein [Gammaproteobacteria bacterium]NIT63677.1 hypothetical protein [Gammaproteobacteria bacterium]NIV21535.1 hypothetical protein [Gammaproteobacteria bacterium]NIY32257.1 hypothetical protein [Gammaproteobacteria bacterium]
MRLPVISGTLGQGASITSPTRSGAVIDGLEEVNQRFDTGAFAVGAGASATGSPDTLAAVIRIAAIIGAAALGVAWLKR